MIILASQSPRRKELLAEIVEEFHVLPAEIDESVRTGEEPLHYVQRMATEKAATVAASYPKDLVIASDTTVVVADEIFGKPTSRTEAKEMLKKMSGKSHYVYTAVTFQQGERTEQLMSMAEVAFYPLTEKEINDYLAKNEYQDKAGAYGIQGAAKVFVKEVIGDFYAIVGFPVAAVYQTLKDFLGEVCNQ